MRAAHLKIFVVLSVAFLAVSLYRKGLIAVPEVAAPARLVPAMVFLAAGFASSALQWKVILRAKSFTISARDSVISCGLSVFGKYIPGKIWGHLGKAGFIADTYGYPLAEVVTVSVYGQIVTVWSGLLLGALGLSLTGGLRLFGWSLLLVWLLLTMVIFMGVFQTSLAKAMHMLGWPADIFSVDRRSIISTVPLFILTLFFWSAGFFFLASSLSGAQVSPAAGLAFPLGISLGTLAVFFPGGIGVREGVISSFLVLTGAPLPAAVTVSVAARIWYLAGEAALFTVALVVSRTGAGGRA